MKGLLLLIALFGNLNAETCQYIVTPDGFQESEGIYLKMYPNRSDGILDFACVDIQPEGAGFDEKGRVEIRVDGDRVALSRDMDSTRDKTFISYEKDETKFDTCFVIEGKTNIDVALQHKLFSPIRKQYIEWNIKKECTTTPPPDPEPNAPTVSSLTPHEATLNELTTFTINGDNFTGDEVAYIPECEELVYVSRSSTKIEFKCRPRHTIGTKSALVKDKIGDEGTVLKSVDIVIKEATPTEYQLNVNVINIGSATGQVGTTPTGIINCRANNQGTCQAPFTEDSVIISAFASTDSIVDFSETGCSEIVENNCTVPMLDDHVVNVKFKLLEETLTLGLDSMPQTLKLTPNETLDIDFLIKSDESTIKSLQLNLDDGNGAVVCKTNFPSNAPITCQVAYENAGRYTLTGRAYVANGRSNILRLNIEVANSANAPKYTGHQNQEHLQQVGASSIQEAFGVDTATGVQRVGFQTLPQFGQIDLLLSISYNSGLAKGSPKGELGQGWSHDYNILARVEEVDAQTIVLHHSANRKTTFKLDKEGVYLSESRADGIRADYYDKLMKVEGQYVFESVDKSKMLFNSSGKLTRRVNKFGYKLDFQYNADGKLNRVFEPISGIFLKYTYNADGSIQSVKDIKGHTISFQYSGDKLIEVTEADGTVHSFSYNANAEMTSYHVNKGSENFKYFTNVYDDLGRVSTQTSANGYVTTFAFNESSFGLIETTVTTPTGNHRKYKHNSNAQLLESIDELNHKTIYKYTLSGQTHSITNPKGLETKFTYNEKGLVELEEYPNGTSVRKYYDEDTNLIQVDDVLGHMLKMTYVDKYLTKVEKNVGGDVKVLVTNSYEFEYPYADDTTTKVIKKIESTTAKGNKTTQQFFKGRLFSTILPEGHKVENSYNKTGTLKEKKLYENGSTLIGSTQIEYDLKGRGIKFTDAEGNVVSKTYSVFDTVKTLIDARGNVWRTFYDADGNVIKTIDPKGGTVTSEYNQESQMVKVTDANGHSHYQNYDSKGRKTFSFNHAKERLSTTQYDSLDVEVKNYIYDDEGNKILLSEFEYDIPQRKEKSTSHMSSTPRVVEKYLDKKGRVARYLNSASKEKKFDYENHFNTLKSVKNEINEIASQTVDNEGNIETLTDTNINLTSFKNDSTPNITEEKSALQKVHRSTYNAHQLLESFTNARGQKQEFTYYKNGWLKTVKLEGVTWSYVYDANGNVLTITGTDGSKITRTYDELNRITSYTDILGETQHYDYDKVGNLLTLTYPDGKKATYTYDSENRMKSVTFDGEKVVDYSYTRTGKLKTKAWANGITRTYVYYNGVGELQSISDKKADGTVVLAFTFEYDILGNIVKETKTIKGETETFEHTYDDIGTLLTSKIGSENKAHYASFAPVMLYDKDNRIKSIDGQTVSYDADGNMLSYHIDKKDRVLEFDAFGHLTKANGTIYRYDIENNKVKTIHNGKTTKFTINPNAKLSQLLMETAPNGDKSYHVYGIGLVATITNHQTSYYHFDYRGSTVALSNKSGDITDSFKYLPYGSMVNHQGTHQTRFLYVGKYGIEREASGLYYMRARYYDADLKRFVSKDSLVGSIANTKSLNRYAYVEGNPIVLIDKNGAFPTWSDVGNTFVSFSEAIVGGMIDGAVSTAKYAKATAIATGRSTAIIATYALNDPIAREILTEDLASDFEEISDNTVDTLLTVGVGLGGGLAKNTAKVALKQEIVFTTKQIGRKNINYTKGSSFFIIGEDMNRVGIASQKYKGANIYQGIKDYDLVWKNSEIGSIVGRLDNSNWYIGQVGIGRTPLDIGIKSEKLFKFDKNSITSSNYRMERELTDTFNMPTFRDGTIGIGIRK